MSTRATLAGCLVLALSIVGCYQDDTTATSPQRLKPRITVRLTDAPFPYDSLHSVTIYVVQIEANTAQDTSVDGRWELITEPARASTCSRCSRAPRPSWARAKCPPASITRSG